MSAQAYYRQSNSSEESPLTDDRSESEHEIPPGNPDDRTHTLNPMSSALSLVTGGGHSLDDRRHSRPRDFDRRSLTNRDLFRYLMEEGKDAKKMRKYFDSLLERLDSETVRRQEAERRALELAQHFKRVNESRIAVQQDLDRTRAELSMYKVQLETANQQIERGSDLLKDLEAQRDNAEAAAARARSTARRLKEEQLMLRAREEGRREGYREGLQRGYQQARGGGLDAASFDPPPEGIPPLDGAGDILARTDPLDGFQMANLPSPTPPPNIPLSSAFGTALRDVPPPNGDAYGVGAQGSRFQEIIGSPGASTVRSAPLRSVLQSAGPSGWSQPADDDPRYIRPKSVHNAPPSPRHADYVIPPEGYIPTMGPDNTIPIPPPHELERPASMSSMRPSNPSVVDDMPPSTSAGMNARDYAYPQQPRGSPRSYQDSLPSTSISQYELVNSPKTATRGLRERSSGLSAIPEVSSSMEFSPGTEGRARNSIVPDSSSFRGPDPRGSVGDIGNASRMSRSRSREDNQRIADELRYSDPDEMEQWRRSTASQTQTSVSYDGMHGPPRPAYISTPSPLGGPPMTPTTPVAGQTPSRRRSQSAQSPSIDNRSYLGTGSSRQRATGTSSASIDISVVPPSDPESNASAASSMRHGMLSPASSNRVLTPQLGQPGGNMPSPAYSGGYNEATVPPSGYAYGAPNPPPPQRYNIPPSLTPGMPVSPRRTPDPLPGFPGLPTPGSSSSSDFSRPVSRGSRVPSAGYGGSMNDLPARSKSSLGRPPSALGAERPPSARPLTPSQTYPMGPTPPGMEYIDTSGRVPAVLRSPSRASSRQSLQPDMPRPSSRATADHHRSLSLNAGSTPAMVPRPLSGGLRRVPSASSINTETSRKSGMYSHYDPGEQLDAAWLASSNDLTSMQSPNTMANTRANAAYANPPGPSRQRPSSPSMSFASFRS
ncbi:hypothetical protein C8Q73DRAFT_324970 [Cubamyces lactineus]|nr:hypothetical protein C8Q73DRAFT_324970 [Cubamyces lactineus]